MLQSMLILLYVTTNEPLLAIAPKRQCF